MLTVGDARWWLCAAQALLQSLRPSLRSRVQPLASGDGEPGVMLTVQQEDLLEYLTTWAAGVEEEDSDSDHATAGAPAL